MSISVNVPVILKESMKTLSLPENSDLNHQSQMSNGIPKNMLDFTKKLHHTAHTEG